jgi:multiple sugar transport system permease protein
MSVNLEKEQKIEKSQLSIGRIVAYVFLIGFALLTVFPMVWMVLSSLKTSSEIVSVPFTLFPESFQWENYRQAFSLAPFHLYMINSFVTSIAIVILQAGFSCMLAYGLSHLEFKGRSVIFQSLLLSYMVPTAVTYVPSYVILARLRLLDNLWGIIISNSASVFSVFLLWQAFKSVPKEVIEAARMEGANDWKILWRVVAPMRKATVFVMSLLTFISMYNNYLWPALILRSQENYLVTVGLRHFYTTQGSFSANLPAIMAANVITILPLFIIFLIFQKWIIKGVSGTGLKG